jgi:hypothetical protein
MKALLLLLLLLVMLGCSPDLSSGTIIELEHQDEETFVTFVPVSSGKSVILVPFYYFDDEDWVVTIQGTGDNGELVEKELYVTEEEYNSLSVGMTYYLLEGVSYDDVHCRIDEPED